MSSFFRLNADAVNIRSGPSSGTSDLGDLVRNDVVEVTERSGNWSRIVDAQHANGSPVMLANGRGAVAFYSGQCWATNAYFVQVAGMPNSEPPPEEPPPATEYILHVKDGVTRKYIPE